MSDNTPFGFAKFVPGFDFLQNLAKGGSQGMPEMPNLASWVAPTLNVEELEKRIGELKAVHYWLDQNSKALGATIQALEVQRMTLATLQGMNFQMADLADALKVKPAAAPKAARPDAKPEAARDEKPEPAAKAKGKAQGAPVDPLQWWGALTEQFQQIAADAMKDVARTTAAPAGGASPAASAAAAAKKKPAAKAAPRKKASKA